MARQGRRREAGVQRKGKCDHRCGPCASEPSSELLAFAHNLDARQLATFRHVATGCKRRGPPPSRFCHPTSATFSTDRNVDVRNIASNSRRTHCARLDADTAHRDGAGRCRRMLRNAVAGHRAIIHQAWLRCRRPCWRCWHNAAITGDVSSGPHDRYRRSRIMWLPARWSRSSASRLAATTCPRTCIQPMKQCHAANVFWSGPRGSAGIGAGSPFASAFIVARLVGSA